jgi:hypothetical protein
MKITGLLLMPAGWIIVLAALVLLRVFLARNLFIAAGVGVEILGLVLFARSHLTATRGNE